MSAERSLLAEVVRDAFHEATDHLRLDVEMMPVDRWNESVFRYFFCRQIAVAHKEVSQFVECGLIDLVLALDSQRAFVEFKFYRLAPRFDPNDGTPRGYKGAAGPKNLGEFRSCVNQLHDRPVPAGTVKYVVLVYADDARNRRRKFSADYDEYRHPRADVALQVVATAGPFEVGQGVVRASLYRVGGA